MSSSSYYIVQTPVPYHLPPMVPPRFISYPHPVILQRPRIQRVKFYDDELSVTVAKNSIHINQWVHGIYRNCSSPHQVTVVGLDIEWLPNLELGDDHPTATLQLCVRNNCLIIQLLHLDRITNTLRRFLGDPRFLFCGVGVEDDVKKLELHHGICVGYYADINYLAKLLGEQNRRCIGLKTRAMEVLKKVMAKPRKVTLSKWDAKELGEDQIEYAAIDAFVSAEIAKVFMDRCLKMNGSN